MRNQKTAALWSVTLLTRLNTSNTDVVCLFGPLTNIFAVRVPNNHWIRTTRVLILALSVALVISQAHFAVRAPRQLLNTTEDCSYQAL